MADKNEEIAMIEFRNVQPKLIRTPFGFLAEIIGRNGRPTGKLGWTRRLTPWKKAVVDVYSYISSVPPVQPEGTYVVLEFEKSDKFFYSRPWPPQRTLVKLKEGGFDPDNAEDIRTTADPRVFLMKPANFGGRSGVLFAWHGSPQHVITVFPDPHKPAELLPEGNEGQIFQLHLEISHSDMLETPGE